MNNHMGISYREAVTPTEDSDNSSARRNNLISGFALALLVVMLLMTINGVSY